jgi:hypothetical protein
MPHQTDHEHQTKTGQRRESDHAYDITRCHLFVCSVLLLLCLEGFLKEFAQIHLLG